MYQFEKIKLVIWDLDDTFWQGTLSEGDILIPDSNIKLINDLTDIGIVNSICSKNDENKVNAELKKHGLDDFFVFASINWESKGNRVKQILKEMNLRETNVLFLDDNHFNREEVKFTCPEIMIGTPEDLDHLIANCKTAEKKDLSHKRLKQYHVLETKKAEESKYDTNNDFLFASDIKVKVEEKCINRIDRIHDLILRSNQLNFTKIRSSKEELEKVINDPSIRAGVVFVSDRFGDYGLVGFYALRKQKLLHFVFSCRVLGMGIEQYLYNSLGRPELLISGEVVSDLSSLEIPAWINQKNAKAKSVSKLKISELTEHSVLIKGPCDLFQIYPYISNTELFDTDFSRTTDDGTQIESTSHTTQMVEAIRLSGKQKELVNNEVPFVCSDIYDDSFYVNNYKIIIISILQDANLGVYRRKESGERFAVLEYLHPLTDKANWDKIISGEYYNAGIKFDKKMLTEFCEKYEFIGRNTPEQVVSNLNFIRQNISNECQLVVMLGGELYYEKNANEAYEDRHIVHKAINDAIRQWANGVKNVSFIDVNKYLVDQSSFYDHFNHYIKPVYYSLAKDIVDVVNSTLGTEIKETSKLKMVQVRIKEILAPLYYKIKKRK